MLGWTQTEIADMVGVNKSTISRVLQNTDFGKMQQEIETFLEQGKTMDWIAEHYSIDLTLAWAIRRATVRLRKINTF